MSVVSCGYQSSSYFENGFITKFLKLIISHFHFEANVYMLGDWNVPYGNSKV